MDDLISRQAAVDIVDFECGEWRGLAKTIIDRFEALPSAQPERLTDDDFETIRIHLNAYKEKLCNQHRWEEADEYQRIIDRFMSFASAQPDVPDTNVGDMISRQAAIDAVRSYYDECDEQEESIEERIERLPSADIDLSDFSDKLWRAAYERGKAEAVRWIPVSEQLPEDEQEVLFSTKTGWVHLGRYYNDNSVNQWYSSLEKMRAWNNVVNAWMPLPEPYKDGEQNG